MKQKVYYQNEFDRQNNHTVQYAFIVPKRFFWGHFRCPYVKKQVMKNMEKTAVMGPREIKLELSGTKKLL